ncbi:hypothetical protein VIGAN_01404400 [Vigna angularis var. angularis]|uniref:Uncharacterized protein n=1 Tax=Vigna angularis var. angularis TaxID=157739 RepID=A0A0S3R665_PHAAN|nr:hypothetical protein VIGAN_01404400 [Vigna angularis var. angularis]
MQIICIIHAGRHKNGAGRHFLLFPAESHAGRHKTGAGRHFLLSPAGKVTLGAPKWRWAQLSAVAVVFDSLGVPGVVLDVL